MIKIIITEYRFNVWAPTSYQIMLLKFLNVFACRASKHVGCFRRDRVNHKLIHLNLYNTSIYLHEIVLSKIITWKYLIRQIFCIITYFGAQKSIRTYHIFSSLKLAPSGIFSQNIRKQSTNTSRSLLYNDKLVINSFYVLTLKNCKIYTFILCEWESNDK